MPLDARLFIQGTVTVVTGLLFAYVGRIVLARRLDPDAHRANLAFATWWWAFGAVELISGVYSIAAAFGFRDLALVVTLLNLLLVLIVAAVGSLVYFLLYVYTGSRRALWPVLLAYGSMAIGFLYLVAWMQPLGFDEARGAGRITFARELGPGASVVIGLFFSGPVLVAALGYGSLFFRATGRLQRFRIGAVAGSFIVWFGWSFLRSVLQLSERYPRSNLLLAVGSALSIGAALVVMSAYRPPRWVTRRFRLAAPDPS